MPWRKRFERCGTGRWRKRFGFDVWHDEWDIDGVALLRLGAVLLGLVRPGYTGVELVDCMLASSDKTDAGTPMLKLTQAINKCPAK